METFWHPFNKPSRINWQAWGKSTNIEPIAHDAYNLFSDVSASTVNSAAPRMALLAWMAGHGGLAAA
jgi:hypothetical protein